MSYQSSIRIMFLNRRWDIRLCQDRHVVDVCHGLGLVRSLLHPCQRVVTLSSCMDIFAELHLHMGDLLPCHLIDSVLVANAYTHVSFARPRLPTILLKINNYLVMLTGLENLDDARHIFINLHYVEPQTYPCPFDDCCRALRSASLLEHASPSVFVPDQRASIPRITKHLRFFHLNLPTPSSIRSQFLSGIGNCLGIDESRTCSTPSVRV